MKQTQTETVNDTLADQLAGYYKLFEMGKTALDPLSLEIQNFVFFGNQH